MQRLGGGGGGGGLLTKRVMNAVVSGSSFYGASDAISLSHSVDPLSLRKIVRTP